MHEDSSNSSSHHENTSGQPFITMGSIISLSHFEDSNAFIYIDGHIKQRVAVRNFSSLSGNQGDEVQSASETAQNKASGLSKNMKFSGCLFQILPKLSDKQKEEIQQKTQTGIYSEEQQLSDDDEQSIYPFSQKTSRQQSKFEFNNVIHSNFGSQQFDQVKEASVRGLNQLALPQKEQGEANSEVESSVRRKRRGQELDKEKVVQLQGKLMNEFKVNYEAFEKYKHNRITYSQTIQLMHINSSKFLACYLQEATVEKGNYKVTLDDYTSENTLFRIVPAFKYQKDGDLTIYANEIIVIERVNPFHNKKTSLHASDEIPRQKQLAFLEIPKQISNNIHEQVLQMKAKTSDTQQVKLPLMQQQSMSSAKVIKREVNVTTENDNDLTKWKINLFSYYMENKFRFLRCGDVVWLHHSEANALLGAQRKKELKDIPQNDWHRMDSKDNLEVNIVPADISNNLEEYSGNTCGMWIIERNKFKVGGYIQFDSHYRLRHLSSGLYLSVYMPLRDPLFKSSIDTNNLQMQLVNSPSDSSLFQFVSLETNQTQKYIKADQFVQLRHVLTKTWVDLSQKPDENNSKNQGILMGQEHENKKDDNNGIEKSSNTSLKPQLSQVRTENQVFKLFSANESDIWEINFVISASRQLTKLLKVIGRLQISIHQIDKDNPLNSINLTEEEFQKVKFFKKKILKLITTIKHLTEFCNNRMHNSSFDQKFGSINHFRQKLLREQYYIDILTQLLQTIFQPKELELLNGLDDNLADIIEKKAQIQFHKKQQIQKRRQSTAAFTQSLEKKHKFNSIDYLKYIKTKRMLCINIYKLLTSICKNNSENELYIYDLLPLFANHCRSIPQAIDCLISIIGSNETLLLKLNENIVIPKSSQAALPPNQLLIEFQEKHKEKTIIPEVAKTNKSMNFLNFFMDMIYNDAPLKADYYRFLSSVSKYKNDGISLNQENIFKLYKAKQQSSLDPSFVNIIDRFKNGIVIPNNLKDLHELYHQLTFLSDVSFGRNFQWLGELVGYFKFDYLLENIWKNIRTNSTASLSSCFSKLAMALYIDHYPLFPINRPNYCRIFHDTKKTKKLMKFEPTNQGLYSGLLNNLLNYLKDISGKVENELGNHKIKEKQKQTNEKAGGMVRWDTDTKDSNQKDIGAQILNEDLLFQSVNMLNLFVDLDVFQIMSRTTDYESIVQHLIKIFSYDRMNISFCSTAYFHQKLIAEQKQEEKKNALLKKFVKLEVKMNDFNIFADDADDDDNEEDEDADNEEINKASSKINENQLFHNPLMRGYLKMNCLLERQISTEEDGTQLEINIKLQICDLFEKMLDMRQDYLVENVLHWFYKSVSGMLEETDETKMEQIFLEGCSKIMPNIPKTGFKEVDELFNKPKEENALNFLSVLTSSTSVNFKFQAFGQSTFHDLDSLLSISYLKNEEETQNPSFAILPYLLQSFLLMHSPQLEKKCLSLLMRLFNQRNELQDNLNKLEVIFDKNKAILYSILSSNIHEFTKYIEQTEDWFQVFILDDQNYMTFKPVCRLGAILKSLKNCFFSNVTLNEEQNSISPDPHNNNIDPNKQKIFLYLKAYKPILDFIKDSMHHLNAIMSDMNQPSQKKEMIHQIFCDTYEMLMYFCWENPETQALLFEEIYALLQYLYIDVGQIKLLCEIFRDNLSLLKEKTNKSIIQILVDLILNYGRQHRILDFFEVFQQCEGKYIFDNQLLILNTFLPINNFGETQLKLLYSTLQARGDRSIALDFKNQNMTDQDLSFIEYTIKQKTFVRDDTFLYHAKLLKMLLQTTFIEVVDDSDPFQTVSKQTFNISIAKLKAIDPTFLKDQLVELDNFKARPSSYNNNNNSMDSPQPQDYQQDSQPDTSRIIQNNNSYLNGNNNLGSNTPSNLMLLSGNKNIFMPKNAINREQAHKESEFLYQGLTHLKPYIVNFLENVYILGEGSTSLSGDNSTSVQFLDRLLSCEMHRMKQFQHATEISEKYSDYLCDNVIPFFQAYIQKYLPKIQEISDKDHKDLSDLMAFCGELFKKLSLFDQKLHPKQSIRMIKFLKDVLYENPAISYDLIKAKEFSGKEGGFFVEETNSIVQLRGAPEDMIISDKNTVPLLKLSSQPSQQDSSGQDTPEKSAPKRAATKARSTKSAFSKISGKVMKGLKFISLQADRQQPEVEEILDSKIPDIQLSSQWHMFMQFMNSNDQVQDEVDKEKMALTEAILSIKSIVPEDLLTDVIPKPDRYLLIKKFITFLQYAVEDATNKNTIKVMLRVIRNIIEKSEDNEEAKCRMQITLDQLGATRMALYVISENHKNLDSELLSEFLEFLNTLLSGGNIHVQKTIYEYYMSHQKSEMIFKRFDQIVRKQIATIESQSKVSLTSSRKASKIFNPSFDGEEEDAGDKENDIDVKLLDNVLTFLQLSAEGHYLNLQNYLRLQQNSRNSFDMINAVADLLKSYYFESRTQKMYENMIQCLDTLNELVQGPCLENQMAVSESKFFEIANDLFSSKKQTSLNTSTTSQSSNMSKSGLRRSFKSSKTSGKGDELENWQIARLQNKSLILILSLMEMRVIDETNVIIKKIMRNVSMQQLEYLLVDIYKLYEQIYKEEYTMECLEYLDKDPKDVPANKQINLECVVQNGFYIIFLVQYYLLFDPKSENIFQSLNKQHKGKLLKVTKNALDGLLYGDHLFGQLASFVMSFVKAGIKSANQMKNFAMNQILGEEDEQKRKRDEEEMHRTLLRQAFFFFNDNTGHIDIIRNNQIEIVFFMVLPYMRCLPKEKKTEFHENVDRQSVKSKIEDLMQHSKSMIEICKHEFFLSQLFSHNKIIALFANYVNLWKQLTFTLTLVLNIFNMISFDATFGDRVSTYLLYNINTGGRFSQDETKKIYLVLGIVMTVCSGFVVLFFLFKNVPLILKKNWIVKYGKNPPGIIKRVVTNLKLFLKVFFIFMQEIEVIYYIAYGAMAVLGTFFHPLFFTFHLTEILIRYPTLKNVMKSVSIPRKSFYLTFILFLILVYSFTVLSYNFFHNDYQSQCDRMLVCFLINFDQTFKSNGAVGGWLTGNEDNNGQGHQIYTVGRLLFDNFYNYIMVIILVEIVAGLIVEAFEGLREKESTKNRDISDKCFICDILKTEFNRKQDNNGGFLEHIKLNHHMWSYIHFVAYLLQKESTEYSGIESYISAKLEENDISWFPINKARELSFLNDEDELAEQEYIQLVNEQILNSIESFKDTDKMFTKSSKKKSNG